MGPFFLCLLLVSRARAFKYSEGGFSRAYGQMGPFLGRARERRKDLNKSSAWRVLVHARAHTAAARYYYYKYKKYPSYNVINGHFKVLS